MFCFNFHPEVYSEKSRTVKINEENSRNVKGKNKADHKVKLRFRTVKVRTSEVCTKP